MHKRVTRLVGAGRLATKPGPRNTVLVNIVALNRAIATETDPAQALRNGSPPEEAGDEPGDVTAPLTAAPTGYHASRSQREAYQAENARLDLEERLLRLADKDDVERRTMATMRVLRDRLLALPATISDRLAAAPDARAVRTLLTNELRAVLEALATRLEALDDDDDGFGAEDGERSEDQG